jgi:2-polyprenyl-3-methyl-5-hydroxy-6-metoxy-1,4-benzoquinol methylase
MRESIFDRDQNIKFNRDRWGKKESWVEKDQFGYRWGGGVQQTVGTIAKFADGYLKPYTGGRYDHTVLELSPGGGRFTAELIRYAAKIDLLDMNQACLDICKERFRYYPIEMQFFENDGRDCDVLGDGEYSLIACFDSMVHMHPDIIDGYVRQLGTRLSQNGILWLDHSGKGARELGHRTDMTAEKMANFGATHGLILVEQRFRNDHDCVSIFRKGA